MDNLYNNKIFHESFDNTPKNKMPKYNPVEIRFTKVLTKYSTEFNNKVFILNICQNLKMDKKDMFIYFKHLKIIHPTIETIYKLLEEFNISKLDVDRMYRYIDCVSEEN